MASRRLLAIFLLSFLALLPLALSSSHSEAPGTSVNPTNDATDFYAFRSYESGRSDYIVFVANYYPFQNPYGGPNYFALSTDYAYEIALDFTGDSVEDAVYRFVMGYNLGGSGQTGITLNIGGVDVAVPLKFVGTVSGPTDPNLNFVEYYRLYYVNPATNATTQASVTGTGATTFYKPLDNVGTKTISNYSNYVQQFYYQTNFGNCVDNTGRVFVGQRRESFSVNLGGIFDLVDFVPIDVVSGFPGSISNDPSNNIISKNSVTSFVLEVPLSCLPVSSNNGVVGAWTRTLTLSHADDGTHVVGRQVQRLGNPLVNELVIGLPDKDSYNSQPPAAEIQYANYVLTPSFVEILNYFLLDAVNAGLGTDFETLAPKTPRSDLVATFLTGIENINQPPTPVPGDMLRLNTAVAPVAIGSQNTYGVIEGDSAGFPNGRRPGDDVVDIALRVIMGKLYWIDGLGFGNSTQAVVGNVPFIDGAPISSTDFQSVFPFLNDPLPGSGSF